MTSVSWVESLIASQTKYWPRSLSLGLFSFLFTWIPELVSFSPVVLACEKQEEVVGWTSEKQVNRTGDLLDLRTWVRREWGQQMRWATLEEKQGRQWILFKHAELEAYRNAGRELPCLIINLVTYYLTFYNIAIMNNHHPLISPSPALPCCNSDYDQEEMSLWIK